MVAPHRRIRVAPSGPGSALAAVRALRAASEEITQKVFANVSKRAADQIREEMDLQGPMKLSDVEQVQQQVVAEARRLEEEGKLTISAGGDDDVLV